VTSELGTLGLPANVQAAMANGTLPNGGAYAPPEYQEPPPSPSFWQKVGDWVWNTLSGIANAIGVTKLISVAWNWIDAAGAYVLYAATWLSNHLGIGKLANQLANGLRTIASAMVWALEQLVSYLYGMVKAALALVINPIVKAASGIDSNVAVAGNSTLTDIEKNGTVSTSHGLAWANSMVPVVILGDALAVIVVVALTLITPFDLGANFLLTAFLTVLPTIAQSALGGLPHSISFSSSGVLSLESSLTAIPKTTWEAIAGTVAIVASGGDLIGANILLATDGAKTGAAAVILPAAMTIDIFVLMITIVNWAPHLAILTGAALALALVATGIAGTAIALGGEQLESYAGWALLFAFVGLGAAIADYVLDGG